MDRRAFVVGALALLAAPLVVKAQHVGRAVKIGVLSGNSRNNDPCLDALRRGLNAFGYIENQNYMFDARWVQGQAELFKPLALDLVKRQVDLIVAFTSGATLTAKLATQTIPIVMAASLYPVEEGIVASLAHPGGNITGVATFTPDLIAKRVQILKDAVPTVGRVAVIRQPGRGHDRIIHDLEMAARTLSVQLDTITVQSAEELPGAFQAAIQRGDHAIMTTQGPFFSLHRAQIARLALEHKLPSLSGEAAAPAAGTLLFYGPRVWEDCERSARYVDRILKGAKPGNLPVEQPTKFELVINLKTAKALGLTIPPSVLARADEIIQ